MARDHRDHAATATSICRREVLRGAVVGGVALPLLAGCGQESTAPTAPATPAGPGSGDPGDGAGLVATSDVPVGGGVVLGEEQIVVTQPNQGQFAAFTAVCTHQGCTVSSVTDGAILCPCHGSTFSAQDGSVINGPASAPLAEVAVTVQGDQVVRA